MLQQLAESVEIAIHRNSISLVSASYSTSLVVVVVVVVLFSTFQSPTTSLLVYVCPALCVSASVCALFLFRVFFCRDTTDSVKAIVYKGARRQARQRHAPGVVERTSNVFDACVRAGRMREIQMHINTMHIVSSHASHTRANTFIVPQKNLNRSPGHTTTTTTTTSAGGKKDPQSIEGVGLWNGEGSDDDDDERVISSDCPPVDAHHANDHTRSVGNLK